MSRFSPTWTDERIERLKSLWKDGLSARQIASQLGGFGHCGDGGRSAVIGKIHRLNLTVRAKPGNSVRTRQRHANANRSLANKVKAGTFAKPVPACVPYVEPKPVNVPYAGPRYGILDDQLGHLMCRAIVEGEGATTLFCSAPTVNGPFRFCRDHAAVYLTAPTGRTWSPERRQKQTLATMRRASGVAA